MHSDYLLITDDSCDLPRSYLEERDIKTLYLSFIIDGVSYKSIDMPPPEFYAQMRSGKLPTTAQVPVEDFLALFEPYLQEEKDILYLAFSSGLSGTCNSAQVAARELSEKYPGRKLIVVDTLCASLGQGLFLHKAYQKKQEGLSIEELAQWVTDNRLRVSHMVTVDDLMHLHRGGRVSKASAIAGTMLGIKPMIHMNNEGKLMPIGKIRGRKQALNNVVDRTAELVGDVENDIFMVCHSDCLEDAEYIAALAKERFGVKECLIDYIGPVIGSHTGPGTVALFMMANHR